MAENPQPDCFCRCNVTTNEELIAWNAHWRISRQTMLCRICGAEQAETDRAEGFSHLPGCVQAHTGHCPWDELDRICKPFERKPGP
jgi:hypothetical protein